MIRIVTHSGDFHADEVFAVATLRMVLGAVPSELIRTRDEEEIKTGDYVVDVGGVYDQEKNRFDHHQEGRAGNHPNGIPYSSFGLVWKKFGPQVSGSPEIARQIMKSLVVPIDANDNGVEVYDLKFPDVEPFGISRLMTIWRPSFHEHEQNFDVAFEKAVSFARTVLERLIEQEKGEIEARKRIEKIIAETADPRVIILDAVYPWERTIADHTEVLYTVRQQSENLWRMKAARKDPKSFALRKPFPLAWAGKRGEELAKITGVPDALFCHNNRFIVTAGSKEGVLALAKLALANEEE